MDAFDTDSGTPFSGIMDRSGINLALLVLESQGIPAGFRREGEGFVLLIDPVFAVRAGNALESYFRENRPENLPDPEGLSQRPSKPGASIGAALLILVVHWAGYRLGIHDTLVRQFGASALYIFQGEIYRCFTALLVHADFQHLAGNIAGLLVLGVPVCTRAGSMAGLLLMAGAGTAGNLMNALLHRNSHLSIGASTAVMGAAGVLVAFRMIRPVPSRRLLRHHILIPLGAGIALVGMLSGGERTDVTAHFFGFLLGIVLGSLYGCKDHGDGPVSPQARRVAAGALLATALIWFLMK